jgi:hypothetical protein
LTWGAIPLASIPVMVTISKIQPSVKFSRLCPIT